MAWVGTAGRKVKYRNAQGRVFRARIFNRDSDTQLDLQVGRGASQQTLNNAVRITSPRDVDDTDAGWYR